MNVSQRLAEYRRARTDLDDDTPVVDGLTRRQLIDKHARKVRFVARRIANRLPDHATVELDDLISVGSLGLLDALDKFDAGKDTSFGTYAEFRIRGSMLDYLRSIDPASRTVREKANRLQRTVRELELKLQRPPESHEIADGLGMTLDEYYRMLDDVKSNTVISLESPRGSGEEGGETLGDTLVGEQFVAPDEALNRREAMEHLAEAVRTALPKRHQQLLSMYYERSMNMKEIGAVLGVTESRVCQLHSEACARLRANLAEALRPGESFPNKRRRGRS